MKPQRLLLARLDGLMARLEHAKEAIAAVGPGTRLQKRIGENLSRRLADRILTLKARRGKIQDGNIPQSAWSDVNSPASVSLLDECLLYLQAVQSRGPDSAPDLCQITDTLFEELAVKGDLGGWKSFSVFSAEDSFDALTQIIRIRYPVSAVWDLPIAVHEFGHFASRTLLHRRADGSTYVSFQEHKTGFVPPIWNRAVRGAAASGQSETAPSPGMDWVVFLDELFADVFATYAAGPSFACSCLLMRFDPANPHAEPDGKHPSYAKRAYAILQTLRHRDNEQPGRRELGAVIKLLENAWRDACLAAGNSSTLSERDETWLAGQIATIYYMLKTDSGGLRFNDWGTAGSKHAWLEKCPPEPVPDFSIVELLNTAWICRLKEDSNPRLLSENFGKLAWLKAEAYD